jgi:hypothetical protein
MASSSLGTSLVPLVNRLQDIFGQARRRGARARPAGGAHVPCACLTARRARPQAGIATGDLELPQVAVVGCQSSGKSSVLEALVRAGARGRQALPVGLTQPRAGRARLPAARHRDLHAPPARAAAGAHARAAGPAAGVGRVPAPARGSLHGL